MDVSTASAIAALAVAFFALLVAFAQVVQQYLVSGQLIRICDSVVYGKMPGQGHRVWEYSQFRFRIVYSVPRIGLIKELWMHSSEQAGHTSTESRLPNLSVSDSKASRSSIAGEASWVSFTRTIQYASGNSLCYEMVEGDADRCPTDLPVVPMQLSMRDVIAMGIVAGLQCTDISFEQQSLSMQGSAGTITSSRHPVLGALIHFSPRQPFEHHGIPTKKSTLDPSWLARMTDMISVAGVRFDERDRRHFEEDEGSWIRSSFGMTVRDGAKAPDIPTRVIRRRTNPKNQSDALLAKELTALQDRNIIKSSAIERQNFANGLHLPQDGTWSFTSSFNNAVEHQTLGCRKGSEAPHQQPSYQGSKHLMFASLQRRMRRLLRSRNLEDTNSVLPMAKPQDDIEHSPGNYILSESKAPAPPIKMKSRAVRSTVEENASHRSVDKQDFKNYILEKRQLATSEQGLVVAPRIKSTQLLLTSSHHDSEGESPVLPTQLPLAQPSTAEDNDARTDFVVDKWQRTFKERQRLRSRRRSRVNRSSPNRPGQNVQDRKNVNPEIEALRSIDGVATDQDLDGDKGCRISTWAPRRKSKLELNSNHTFPRAIRTTPLLKQRIHRDDSATIRPILISPLRPRIPNLLKPSSSKAKDHSADSEIYFTDDESLRDGRHSRSRSGHQSRMHSSDRFGSSSCSLDEQPMFRRGRRRNSSLVGRKQRPGGSSGHFAYGNGPVRSEHWASTDAQAHQPLDPGFQGRPRRRVRMVSPSRSPSNSSNDKQTPALNSPSSPANGLAPPKSALRQPRERFPEDPNFVREGVAPIRFAPGEREIPSEARWTKIDRRLVNPAALESGDERFVKKPDYVIVLRVLTKEEIRLYAMQTSKIREHKRAEKRRKFRAYPMSYESHEGNGTEFPADESDESFASFERMPSRPTAAAEGTRTGTYTQHDDSALDEPASPRSPSSSNQDAEEPLTYQEELLFIGSEDILKYVRTSTEKCKDISVTLHHFLDDQATLDSRVSQTVERIKILNELLKQMLLMIEPLRGERKVAIFVTEELSVLTRSMRVAIELLENDFALFDIAPLPLEARRERWKNLMLAFEEENPCSLPEHLGLSCRYGKEVLANMQAGVLSTPESKRAKSRMCKLNGLEQYSAPTRSFDPPETLPLIDAYAERDYTDTSNFNSLLSLKINHKHLNCDENGDHTSEKIVSENPSHDEDGTFISSTLAESRSSITGQVNWFWLSQADIIPGYWATPWKDLFSEAVCLGATSVFLKVLEHYTDASNCKYVNSQMRCFEWVSAGKATYPSYAHNSRGGVIVSGTYDLASFPAFGRAITPIELLYSYKYQVDRSQPQTSKSVTDSIGELMGLDSWLSLAGRLPEITLGSGNLLRTLPTLAQRIFTDFDLEFSSLDRTSSDRGLQIIRTIAEGLVQTFEEQGLSEAEQLFTDVALLRTAKVGLCVARGPNTSELRDVLHHDVQVYMA